MDIIIQGIGFATGETLDNFVREKLGTLKSSKIIRANVTFRLNQRKDDEQKDCEILLEIPGNDLFVKKSGKFFETAASDCIALLHQQLKREKEKIQDRRQADADVIRKTINPTTSGE